MSEADAPAGIDPEPVTAWMAEHIDGVEPPLRFERVAGGHSCLTYIVEDATGGRYVLRRPPIGHVLATAHDVAREHKIISALADSDVPVRAGPRPVHRRHRERRRRSTSWGSSTASCSTTPTRRRAAHRRRPAGGPASTSSTSWSPPRRRHRRRRARRPVEAHRLPRPPAAAVDGPVGGLEDQGGARHGAPPGVARRQPAGRRRDAASSTATSASATASTRPTAPSWRCSTGSCARSATRWPTCRTCCARGPSPATRRGPAPTRPAGPPGFPTREELADPLRRPLGPRPRGPRRTGWRSTRGARRASCRACTTGTSTGRWRRAATRTSTASSSRSTEGMVAGLRGRRPRVAVARARRRRDARIARQPAPAARGALATDQRPV